MPMQHVREAVKNLVAALATGRVTEVRANNGEFGSWISVEVTCEVHPPRVLAEEESPLWTPELDGLAVAGGGCVRVTKLRARGPEVSIELMPARGPQNTPSRVAPFGLPHSADFFRKLGVAGFEQALRETQAKTRQRLDDALVEKIQSLVRQRAQLAYNAALVTATLDVLAMPEEKG